MAPQDDPPATLLAQLERLIGWLEEALGGDSALIPADPYAVEAAAQRSAADPLAQAAARQVANTDAWRLPPDALAHLGQDLRLVESLNRVLRWKLRTELVPAPGARTKVSQERLAWARDNLKAPFVVTDSEGRILCASYDPAAEELAAKVLLDEERQGDLIIAVFLQSPDPQPATDDPNRLAYELDLGIAERLLAITLREIWRVRRTKTRRRRSGMGEPLSLDALQVLRDGSVIELAEVIAASEADPLEKIIAKTTEAELRGSLSERDRQVARLLFDGYTQREIAEVLGCNKMLVSRAVRRIQQRYPRP